MEKPQESGTWVARFVEWLTAERIRAYPTIAAVVAALTGVAYAAFGGPQAKWTLLGADLRAFYTAGRFVDIGRQDLLYDIAAQRGFQAHLDGPLPGVSVWLNPPFFAWPYVLLSRLSFPVALALTCLIGLGLAWAALTMLSRELDGPPARSMMRMAALYYPFWQGLFLGQTTPLALFIFAGVFVLLRRRHDAAAGALLGCLAYKPQLALGLVALLLGARRGKVLGAALAVGAAWAAVSVLTLPQASHDFLFRWAELGRVTRSGDYPVEGLHGLFQVGALLLDDVSPRAGAALGALLTAAGVCALARLFWGRPWMPGTRDWDRRMAAALALAVIASPHLFNYDLAMLVVPLCIAAHLFPEGTGDRPLDGGPLLATTVLVWALALLGPSLTVAQRSATRWAFGHAMGLQIGVLAIALWAWVMARPSSLREEAAWERAARKPSWAGP